MRDKQKTIESLRRLAERPGTPQEGETARRMLKKMEAAPPLPSPAIAGRIPGNKYWDDLRRSPKADPVTWQHIESFIRRHIYRGETGGVD